MPSVDPIALARKLIDCPSVTEGEREVAELLDDELTALGFTTRRHAVSESRFNLLASASGRPRVVLNSHLDTVPPWFGASEDDDYLYGRGACDTKGIIAAMIASAVRLREGGFEDFALLFVVGEETDSIGAKTANTEFADLGSEYVIVGEPTESTFVRATKGAATFKVRFDGIAAHSAYPERGDSAIHKMASAIVEITGADWGEHEILGRSTVNIGVVRGGEKPNVIAPLAECEMIFRLAGDPHATNAQLGELIARYGGTITHFHGNSPQFMVVPEGAESVVVAFNTDVPHLRALGKPLLFGPGSILDAHGERERIGKRELLDAVQTYHDTVLSLCRS